MSTLRSVGLDESPLNSTGPVFLKRRTLLGAALGLPAVLHKAAWARDSAPIKVGQTISLTGPQADLGRAMHQGAKACFSDINAKGGIFGSPIELVALDDGYEAKRAVDNVKTFLDNGDTFALLNCQGTPVVQAILPQVIESGVPFFAPFSGASTVRPNARNIFHLRASYADEVDRLVEHLKTIGIRRIAVVYLNNSYGKDVLDAAEIAMRSRGLKAAAIVSVENDASDAGDAAAKLVAANPEAVLLGVAGKSMLAVVKSLRSIRRGLPLYTLSVMGSAATLSALGDDGIGLTISQVVPMPANATMPVVRDFRKAWAASGTKLEPSHLALEGYVSAKALGVALQRAGRNRSRLSFIEGTRSIKNYDMGGFGLNFTEPTQSASRFVELTMVTRGGKFVR